MGSVLLTWRKGKVVALTHIYIRNDSQANEQGKDYGEDALRAVLEHNEAAPRSYS